MAFKGEFGVFSAPADKGGGDPLSESKTIRQSVNPEGIYSDLVNIGVVRALGGSLLDAFSLLPEGKRKKIVELSECSFAEELKLADQRRRRETEE